jgi:predicted amidophosphoribosyltransferase
MNFKILIHTLFPESCMVCKTFLNEKTETSLCQNCINSLHPTLIQTIEPFPTISLFEYEHPVIKTVLAAIKFHSNVRMAQEFPKELLKIVRSPTSCHSREGGNPVLGFLDPRPRGDDRGVRNERLINTIWIPIPIHPKKRKQRGFNQVDLLFKPIAEHYQIPYIPALKRTKETQALFGLNPAQRQVMMTDAFELDPTHTSSLHGKNILIVDDILTTGATIHEAAKLLQKTGAKSILGFTLAKANL